MSNLEENINERAMRAEGKCEMHGCHVVECKGAANVTHHVIRRRDKHHDEYENRDNVEWLRLAYNGPSRLGTGGCHEFAHKNPIRAELLGLIAGGHGLFGLGQHLPERFWDKVDIRKPAECWPWQAGTNNAGYGRFSWGAGPELANRLVLGLRLNQEGLALHRCDNPPCVNPLHLYVGDHKQNTADAIDRGRLPKLTGASASRSTDEEEVFTIRWLAVTGMGQRRIAARIGKPHNGWVSRVNSGKRWPDGPWPKIDCEADRELAESLGLPVPLVLS